MAFKPGQSGNPHGRPVGTKNRATKALKDMILGALDRGGGEDWLLKQMQANPVAFMTLVGKLLPADLNVRLSVLDTMSDEDIAGMLAAVRAARAQRGEHDPVH